MKNVICFLSLLFCSSCTINQTEYYAISKTQIKVYYAGETFIDYIKPNEVFILYNKSWKSKSKVKYDNLKGYIYTKSSLDYTYTTKPNVSIEKDFNSNSSIPRIINTGPRGGKYYINKNGNKTYVPRGKH